MNFRMYRILMFAFHNNKTKVSDLIAFNVKLKNKSNLKLITTIQSYKKNKNIQAIKDLKRYGFLSHNDDYGDFLPVILTDEGKNAIIEYKYKTKPYIISILSLLVSFASIIISIQGRG